MDLELLKKPLAITDIDFRIQSINKGGYATILAYKDARVDMNRLDEAVGPLNWKREHLNSNANCIISIWDAEKKEWVSKEDTGTESMTEKAKGLASDSFKRSAFNWGIGRELYDYPLIQVKLNANEFEIKKDNKNQERAYPTWNLKLKEWVWSSEFKDNKLIKLSAKDQNNNSRFTWDENAPTPAKVSAPPKTPAKPNLNKFDETQKELANYWTIVNAAKDRGLKAEDLKKHYTISKDVFDHLQIDLA